MVEKLHKSAITFALSRLKGWNLTVDGSGIEKSFSHEDFVQTFAFMTKVALLAEKHAHHPNWSNNYNNLHIKLSTVDCGGISEKDMLLAMAIDSM